MRLPANLGRLLPALCLGVLLSACSTFGQRDPLRIDLVGLEPLPGQGMEMRFMVKLRVQNPNDEPIEYNGIALDLDVNGQPLASGVSDQTGEVPRFGERVVSVPLTVSAFRLPPGLGPEQQRSDPGHALRGEGQARRRPVRHRALQRKGHPRLLRAGRRRAEDQGALRRFGRGARNPI
ncbi:LEA type 2 family protein [Pseudomonas aeruginosa]|uniref:LEA type 2 family protein n=2 Tax=Pseudomonas aeruginosa TaxID=287 RepID=UPI00391EFF3D